jgi:hypothetical protein
MVLRSIGYGGCSAFHRVTAARIRNTPGIVLAIVWVIGTAALMSIFAQSAAIANTKSYPNLSNRTISANELEEILDRNLGATLRNVTIEGKLHLPERLKYLKAVHVTLPDGLDASPEEGNAKVRRGSIRFEESTFGGLVEFYLADIKSLTFVDCDFKNVASFHSLKADELRVLSSTFRSRARFANMRIQSTFVLFDVDFEGYANFAGSVASGYVSLWRLDSSKPIILEWSLLSRRWIDTLTSWADAPEWRNEHKSRALQVETEMRFFKKNFEEIGQKRDALEVNRALIQFHRSHFLSPRDVEWWLTYILEWPTSYGTRPYRPVWIAVAVIVLFAILFFLLNVFKTSDGSSPATAPTHRRIGYSVVYSVNAFVPLLKLMDEDKWGWKLSSRYRWLELIERVCGLVVTLLAAYSVSSYVL